MNITKQPTLQNCEDGVGLPLGQAVLLEWLRTLITLHLKSI